MLMVQVKFPLQHYKLFKKSEAPINQYLYSDYGSTTTSRPGRSYIDDDPYGQMTGDYDYDSDLGLAQGFNKCTISKLL